MKKIILSICSLAILSLLFFSCSKKDDIQPSKKKGQVEFGFSIKIPLKSSDHKLSMKAVAEPAAVIVSIKKGNGNFTYTMEKIELYNMNGYYISKPLSLLPGNYTLEQFFVVDASDSIIYASPLQGSPKAYLVSKPLPINFTIGKDSVTKIVPEVLSTTGSTPEDFGYSTFSFEVVNTFDFLIGVFVYNESLTNFEITTASLNITAGSNTLYADTLEAITNRVTINDGYTNYILTVTKDGYKNWTDTLTATELKLYFRSEDKGPLVVVLEKDTALTKVNYGRLYNWYAVNDARGLAPEGWHIPTTIEWDTLISYLRPDAGNKLKESGNNHWSIPNSETDEYGYKALPAGVRCYFEGSIDGYQAKGNATQWWSTLEYTTIDARAYMISMYSADLFSENINKSIGASIRCIKNNSLNSNFMTDIDGNKYPTVKIGDQVWMAANLIVTRYRNGDSIPEIIGIIEWSDLTTGAWCAYNNDYSNI